LSTSLTVNTAVDTEIGSPGELLKELQAAVDREVVPISAVTGEGLPRLVQAIVERL
jgi:translation initiation factor IF-2